MNQSDIAFLHSSIRGREESRVNILQFKPRALSRQIFKYFIAEKVVDSPRYNADSALRKDENHVSAGILFLPFVETIQAGASILEDVCNVDVVVHLVLGAVDRVKDDDSRLGLVS